MVNHYNRKKGEPSDKSCTRMNFQNYNKDNTWETEDCETDLAEYYVCERSFEKNIHGIVQFICCQSLCNKYALF
jgi:hypothetical protein